MKNNLFCTLMGPRLVFNSEPVRKEPSHPRSHLILALAPDGAAPPHLLPCTRRRLAPPHLLPCSRRRLVPPPPRLAAPPRLTSGPTPGAAPSHLLLDSRRRPAPNLQAPHIRGPPRPSTPSLGPGAARPPFSPGPLDAWSPTSPAPGAANRPAPLAPVAAPACSPPAGMTARIRTAWWGSESRRSGAPPPLAIGSSLFMVKPRVLVGDHKKQAVKELGDMVQRCGQFNYLNCLTGMTSDSE
nr:classical arabinogalactan protein 9 [Aegilops tauschii subsp. strangulata]